MILKTNKKIIEKCLIILTIIGVAFVLKATSSVFIPLICALFLYMLFVPLAIRLDNAKVPKYISTLIVIVIIACFLVGIYFIFANIFNTISNTVPKYTKTLQNIDSWLAEFLASHLGSDIFKSNSFINSFNIDWKVTIADWFTRVSNFIIYLSKSLGLIFIYLLFMMIERETFVKKITLFHSDEKRIAVSTMVSKIIKDIQHYVVIKTIVSFLTGLCVAVLCCCMKFELFLLSGILAFVFNFIPSIGSIVVTFLISFLSIMQFAPNFYPVIIIFVGITVIEMVIGNFIDPRLSGNTLNLSPLVILISLSICGYIWGVIGMFFSVMFVSVLRIISSYVPEMKFLEVILSDPKKSLVNYLHKDDTDSQNTEDSQDTSSFEESKLKDTNKDEE